MTNNKNIRFVFTRLQNLLKYAVIAGLLAGVLSAGSASAMSPERGIVNSEKSTGIPLFLIIEVNWNGVEQGSYTLWGPVWASVAGTGTVLDGCTNCLDISYNFVFKGNTVQFDETYPSYVSATPQVRRVVLHDADGDGKYTGSLSAERYEFSHDRALYMDRVDYEITFSSNRTLVNFRMLEYEHRKIFGA
jgi:hypothetical protein